MNFFSRLEGFLENVEKATSSALSTGADSDSTAAADHDDSTSHEHEHKLAARDRLVSNVASSTTSLPSPVPPGIFYFVMCCDHYEMRDALGQHVSLEFCPTHMYVQCPLVPPSLLQMSCSALDQLYPLGLTLPSSSKVCLS